jgi:hypothetical protein
MAFSYTPLVLIRNKKLERRFRWVLAVNISPSEYESQSSDSDEDLLLHPAISGLLLSTIRSSQRIELVRKALWSHRMYLDEEMAISDENRQSKCRYSHEQSTATYEGPRDYRVWWALDPA